MDNTTDKRAQLLQRWLNKHYDIVEDSFTPVSGDASFRRYFRFTAKDVFGFKQVSLVAVDAPPEKEDSQPFIDIATLLFNHQLPVPEIYQSSLQEGFYVQQDFGDQLLHGSLNENSADYLYDLAMGYIINLQKVNTNNLPPYDSALLQREMQLFSDWYLTKHLNLSLDKTTTEVLNQTYALLEQNALEQPQVFVHRDYHSRNLMVISYNKLGIIDFQDAVKGPLTYDVVSLLRDCYIDWPQHKIIQWLEQYNTKLETPHDISQLTRWFDLMGMQRHLKATGIFCRLNYRDGKSGYLNDIPRTLNYIKDVSEKYQELSAFSTFLKTATMKAMILAAGRGNRLRPLTDKRPKPLVQVGNDTLIEHHIKKIANAGFESIVINTSYLGEIIRNRIGDGSKYNIPIEYSDEGEQALETGGGISYALPLLGDQPFLAISADIYCDISFDSSYKLDHSNMHLIMVNNPTHHPDGDFTESELRISDTSNRLTYSGIAYIHPRIFTHEKRAFPLLNNIRECIKDEKISASKYEGMWFDIGTGFRLHEANKKLLNL